MQDLLKLIASLKTNNRFDELTKTLFSISIRDAYENSELYQETDIDDNLVVILTIMQAAAAVQIQTTDSKSLINFLNEQFYRVSLDAYSDDNGKIDPEILEELSKLKDQITRTIELIENLKKQAK